MDKRLRNQSAVGSLTDLCAVAAHTPTSSGTSSRWGAAETTAAGSLAGCPEHACAAREGTVVHIGAAGALCEATDTRISMTRRCVMLMLLWCQTPRVFNSRQMLVGQLEVSSLGMIALSARATAFALKHQPYMPWVAMKVYAKPDCWHLQGKGWNCLTNFGAAASNGPSAHGGRADGSEGASVACGQVTASRAGAACAPVQFRMPPSGVGGTMPPQPGSAAEHKNIQSLRQIGLNRSLLATGRRPILRQLALLVLVVPTAKFGSKPSQRCKESRAYRTDKSGHAEIV